MRGWIMTFALGVLAACAAGSAPPTPQEIVAGLDACEYCHMTVDDPARAAQWLPESGAARLFDEPGCLITWLREAPREAATPFVADEGGSGWVSAAEAHYVRNGTRTSMGFDLVAFRDLAAARRHAEATGGAVADWTTVRREEVKNAHAH